MERSQEPTEATISMELDGCPGLRGLHKPGIPPSIEDMFVALRNEITDLHSKWDTFEQLFRDNDSVAALVDVAPGAFYVIQRTLRVDFITTVYRITDPKESGPKTNRKQNLTLEQLHDAIVQLGDSEALLVTLTKKLKEIDSHCSSLRKVRDKTIGHSDKETILKPIDNPLPEVTWNDINKALDLLGEFMNQISAHFSGIHIDFVPNLTGPGRNIVHGLREFKRLLKLENEREQAELRKEFKQS